MMNTIKNNNQWQDSLTSVLLRLLQEFPHSHTGMLAGLSMCFVKSSAISLYAAGKALEVRKPLSTHTKTSLNAAGLSSAGY